MKKRTLYTLFLIGYYGLMVYNCFATDKISFSSNAPLIVGNKSISEIRYVFDRSINIGDKISIQPPPFWQKVVVSSDTLLKISFSKDSINFVTSITNKSIDGYFSVISISVVNIEFKNGSLPVAGDTLFVKFGKEPLNNKGISISRFAGEQRIYYKLARRDSILENDFISIQVKPRTASKIKAVLASTFKKGEYPVLKISFLDEFSNRDIFFSDHIIIQNSQKKTVAEIDADSGYAETNLRFEIQSIDSLFIFTQSGFSAWTNPIILVSDKNPKIWWGDLHTHSFYSGHGRGYIPDLLDYAKESSLLDFVAYTEHDWIYPQTQKEATKEININYIPGKFVAFNGLEWTSKLINEGTGYGHLTIISRDENQVVRLNTTTSTKPNTVFDIAKKNNYWVSINHPIGSYAYDWDYFDDVIRDAEMVSDGYLGLPSNELPLPNTFGMANIDAIKRGLKIGFTGVSDNHYSQPGIKSSDFKKNSGMTAILADTLTRESLFDALKMRHNYATTGARIILQFSTANSVMGDIVNLHTVNKNNIGFTINVVGTNTLSKIEIIRNGSVVTSFSNIFSKSFATVYKGNDLFFEDCSYYLRVTQVDGEMAWSSPIWFINDSLEGVVTSNLDASFSYYEVNKDNIEFLLALITSSSVKFIIYDVLGRVVKSYNDVYMDKGKNNIFWNMDNNRGEKVPSGVYFAKVNGDFGTKIIKLKILR